MNTQRTSIINHIATKAPLKLDKPFEEPQKIFASDVFTDSVLHSMVAESTYHEFIKTRNTNQKLTLSLADQIASALKLWAMEKQATHYSHWFLPLQTSTAEKHDTFLIHCQPCDYQVLHTFSGNNLTASESDASSFPSGGLRSTFEARGYTIWDMSNCPFIRTTNNGNILMIPTAFCSWNGASLDKKTSLLRSEQSICEGSLKLLSAIVKNDTRYIFSTCGAEQEFFLIDRHHYYNRPDIILTERSLISNNNVRNSDHYFGKIPSRVLSYIQDVENQCWKLGIPVKTRHNEVSPSQFEIASLYEKSSVALDHNELLMDILKSSAIKHEFAVLLHEKPFFGVNGSGKHVNWSLSTDKGKNLLEPSEDEKDNIIFLSFLTAIIRSVNKYHDLLNASVACPGNDCRLGGDEAPPSIISIYLGESLNNICISLMEACDKIIKIDNNSSIIIDLGALALPNLLRHSTDRTSPFAFTGNKFEFRAVGSSQDIAIVTTILNTIVADSCIYLAKLIEDGVKNNSEKDKNMIIQRILGGELKKNFNIVYNGNNYSNEWKIEAKKRGLNPLYGIESIFSLTSSKNIDLFKQQKVLFDEEIQAVFQIKLNSFFDTWINELKVINDMIQTIILPDCMKYQRILSETIISTNKILNSTTNQTNFLKKITMNIEKLFEILKNIPISEVENLKNDYVNVDYSKEVFLKVNEFLKNARIISNELESMIDDQIWRLPKYSEILNYLQ